MSSSEVEISNTRDVEFSEETSVDLVQLQFECTN